MIEKPEIGAPCNNCGLCCQRQVCGAGSFALGLVATYGERAPGPCPALIPEGDGFVCGVVLDPKRFLLSSRTAAPLRDAFLILIGAGVGCDEAGDEEDRSAAPKLQVMQERFIDQFGIAAIRRAARLIHGDRWKSRSGA